MRKTHWYTKERPLVYTNIFFLIPLVTALYRENIYFGVLLLLVFMFSTTHHLVKTPGAEWWWQTRGRKKSQTFLLISEIILSFLLAIWSLFLLLSTSELLLWIALILFIPSFILYMSTDYTKYVLYHSIWHVVVAIVITLALF